MEKLFASVAAHLSLTLTIALTALLGACGGGGDSGLVGSDSPTAVDSTSKVESLRRHKQDHPNSLRYTVTDMGLVAPYGINSRGQVTGFGGFAGGRHAFLYSRGSIVHDLGTLSGGCCSYGFGINDKGQVTGYSSLTSDSFGPQHAFLYSDGAMQDLGTLGGSNSSGEAINRKGQVVGSSTLPGDQFLHAFIYSDGTMRDLGTLPGHVASAAYDINNKGQVVGDSVPAGISFIPRAFLYSDGTMRDLGTLGGSSSQAKGINDRGQVVGQSFLAGNTERHAFMYSRGTMQDLGTLGGRESYAYAINNKGQVVGDSYVSGDMTFNAFLYSDGKMWDLIDLIDDSDARQYVHLHTPSSINDAGQIVVNSDTGHGLILTPSKRLCVDEKGDHQPPRDKRHQAKHDDGCERQQVDE
jgi:probable HAF family extracellular repeat protein